MESILVQLLLKDQLFVLKPIKLPFSQGSAYLITRFSSLALYNTIILLKMGWGPHALGGGGDSQHDIWV